MNNVALTGKANTQEPIAWYFGIGSDQKLYLFKTSLTPIEDSLRNFFRLISGPFHTRGEALNESFYTEAHYREFLARRLPHLDAMSAEQHAMVTLVNAACYVTDQKSKRLLHNALRERIGLKAIPLR